MDAEALELGQETRRWPIITIVVGILVALGGSVISALTAFTCALANQCEGFGGPIIGAGVATAAGSLAAGWGFHRLAQLGSRWWYLPALVAFSLMLVVAWSLLDPLA